MWSSALRNCAERISLLELTLLAQLSRLELGSRLTICSAVIDSMGSSLQIFCIRFWFFFSQPCMLYAYTIYTLLLTSGQNFLWHVSQRSDVSQRTGEVSGWFTDNFTCWKWHPPAVNLQGLQLYKQEWNGSTWSALSAQVPKANARIIIIVIFYHASTAIRWTNTGVLLKQKPHIFAIII